MTPSRHTGVCRGGQARRTRGGCSIRRAPAAAALLLFALAACQQAPPPEPTSATTATPPPVETPAAADTTATGAKFRAEQSAKVSVVQKADLKPIDIKIDVDLSKVIDAAKPAADPLPIYPWPPEDPSSLVRLDTTHDFARGGTASLGDVAETLSGALRDAGYLELRYYRAPGGFAMVTRLEGIRPDGTPLGERDRYLLPEDRHDFSFAEFIRGLFFAPEGFYRFIVFIVSDVPYTTSGSALSEQGALARLRQGSVALPAEYGQMPFSPGHRVDALIYEFRKTGQNDQVETLRPGRIPPQAHLEKSGLMSALGE